MSPRPKQIEEQSAVPREQVAHELSRVLRGAESLSAVAPRVLELLARSLHFNVAALWLAPGRDEHLSCRAVWPPASSEPSAGDPITAFVNATRMMRVPPGFDLPGQATSSVATHWIEDLTAEHGFTRADLAREAGLCSVAAFPIASRGEVRGVIELFSTAHMKSDRSTLELFALIGTQLALFVERKQAIATLRSSEDRYRRLSRTFRDSQRLAHVGSFDYDIEEGELQCSEELCRILGIDPQAESFDAEQAATFIAPEDRDRVRAAAQESMAAHQTLDLRFRVQRPDGQQRIVRMRACMASEEGSCPRYTGAVLDITDDEHASDERSALQQELEEAKRLSSLGNLAATMAHEFNNVLMGIESFATFLRRKKSDPETQNAAAHIQQSLKRGRTITDEILRFTRATSPVLDVIDVAAWLRQFMPEASAITGGRVVLEVGGDALFVRGDPGQLNQVLSNLVINARDASPDHELITIRACAAPLDAAAPGAGPCLLLSVIDRGPGIPVHMRQRIFEPLFTTKRHGTGLGLAVVHQVVRAHGGVIRLKTEIGEGTEMRIALPLVAGAQAAVERHGVSRVVLIEEEEMIAAGLHDLLAMDGIHVTVVTRPDQALSTIERVHPDALILDVGLRHIAGEELFTAIAARWPELPAVFMTGHLTSDAAQILAEQPHITLLRKPFDGEELLAALTRVVRRR